MRERARALRKNLTPAESKLWEEVRNRKFYNFRFHRQHRIGPYIVDFVCLMKEVIVELDGDHHKEREQAEWDVIRDNYLSALGYKVLRFSNRDVFEKLDIVLKVILENLLP